MHSGTVKRAVARAWPRKRHHTILEDHDPTGWESKDALTANREAKLRVFRIPQRSPDLNVMDYPIWKAVSTRMRRQERQFPANKVETKAQFLARLHKTAKALPKQLVQKSIADMRRRCQRLNAARGGHFEEGGR